MPNKKGSSVLRPLFRHYSRMLLSTSPVLIVLYNNVGTGKLHCACVVFSAPRASASPHTQVWYGGRKGPSLTDALPYFHRRFRPSILHPRTAQLVAHAQSILSMAGVLCTMVFIYYSHSKSVHKRQAAPD